MLDSSVGIRALGHTRQVLDMEFMASDAGCRYAVELIRRPIAFKTNRHSRYQYVGRFRRTLGVVTIRTIDDPMRTVIKFSLPEPALV